MQSNGFPCAEEFPVVLDWKHRLLNISTPINATCFFSSACTQKTEQPSHIPKSSVSGMQACNARRYHPRLLNEVEEQWEIHPYWLLGNCALKKAEEGRNVSLSEFWFFASVHWPGEDQLCFVDKSNTQGRRSLHHSPHLVLWRLLCINLGCSYIRGIQECSVGRQGRVRSWTFQDPSVAYNVVIGPKDFIAFQKECKGSWLKPLRPEASSGLWQRWSCSTRCVGTTAIEQEAEWCQKLGVLRDKKELKWIRVSYRELLGLLDKRTKPRESRWLKTQMTNVSREG